MAKQCLDLLVQLSHAVEKTNYELADKMSNGTTSYAEICTKPDISSEYYFNLLKQKWDTIVNDFIDHVSTCNGGGAIIGTSFSTQREFETTMKELASVIAVHCRCHKLGILGFLRDLYLAKNMEKREDVKEFLIKKRKFITKYVQQLLRGIDISTLKNPVPFIELKKLFNEEKQVGGGDKIEQARKLLQQLELENPQYRQQFNELNMLLDKLDEQRLMVRPKKTFEYFRPVRDKMNLIIDRLSKNNVIDDDKIKNNITNLKIEFKEYEARDIRDKWPALKRMGILAQDTNDWLIKKLLENESKYQNNINELKINETDILKYNEALRIKQEDFFKKQDERITYVVTELKNQLNDAASYFRRNNYPQIADTLQHLSSKLHQRNIQEITKYVNHLLKDIEQNPKLAMSEVKQKLSMRMAEFSQHGGGANIIEHYNHSLKNHYQNVKLAWHNLVEKIIELNKTVYNENPELGKKLEKKTKELSKNIMQTKYELLAAETEEDLNKILPKIEKIEDEIHEYIRSIYTGDPMHVPAKAMNDTNHAVNALDHTRVNAMVNVKVSDAQKKKAGMSVAMSMIVLISALKQLLPMLGTTGVLKPDQITNFNKILDTTNSSMSKIEQLTSNPQASLEQLNNGMKSIAGIMDTISQTTPTAAHTGVSYIDTFNEAMHKFSELNGQVQALNNSMGPILRGGDRDSDFPQQFLTWIESSDEDFGAQIGGRNDGIIRQELSKLIPDELGSMKDFFVNVIGTYYENMPPIIWAPIFKAMADNFFIELPQSRYQAFQFASKQLLTNSGPFILKTLQGVRPALPPEIAEEYGIYRLKYPKLTERELELVMPRAVPEWSKLNVIASFSASVGHVIMVSPINNSNNVFILKTIKPLSVVQACAEKKYLGSLYSSDTNQKTCANVFINQILDSNLGELNTQHEIHNMELGYKYYTGTYKDDLGIDNVNVSITTVQNIPGIVKPGTWYALAMTLAPGIPLSTLVENNLVRSDTKYRARLHRCLDLLVYHFIKGIVKGNMYHGDLHAGNIFFSFQKCVMTIIDWGSVGTLEVYENSPDSKLFLSILIKSIYHNYDSILDELTEYLNTKCIQDGNVIKQDAKYEVFRRSLVDKHLEDVATNKNKKHINHGYIEQLNSPKRIAAENGPFEKSGRVIGSNKNVSLDTVHDAATLKIKVGEVIMENSEILRNYGQFAPSDESGGFAAVMAKIITFYAESGVNIAIKFPEFFEAQKAYALLLGTLSKVHYDSRRIGWVANKFKQFKNIPFSKPLAAINLYNKNQKQEMLFKKLQSNIDKINK